MGASNDGLRILDSLIHDLILNQNCDKNMSITRIEVAKTLLTHDFRLSYYFVRIGSNLIHGLNSHE